MNLEGNPCRNHESLRQKTTRIMNIKIQKIPLLSPIKKLLSVEKFPTPRLWTESTVEANDPGL